MVEVVDVVELERKLEKVRLQCVVSLASLQLFFSRPLATSLDHSQPLSLGCSGVTTIYRLPQLSGAEFGTSLARWSGSRKYVRNRKGTRSVEGYKYRLQVLGTRETDIGPGPKRTTP